jgi:hypothetical protein
VLVKKNRILGAIDYVARLDDGRIKLGGWAMCSGGSSHRAADDFVLTGRNEYTVVVIARPDIKEADDCGFDLTIASVADLAALYWGGITLQARVDDEILDLRFWDRVEHKVLRIIASHLITLMTNDDEAEALQAAAQAGSTEQELMTYLDGSVNAPIYDNILVQVGSFSKNMEVLIGKNGFLFLMGGSNNLIDQYKGELDHEKSNFWIELVVSRGKYCSERGISFCQMIIPEKQSIVPEYFPIDLKVPTPLFAEISINLSDSALYIDCQKALRDLFIFGGNEPFRKVDSHLSYFGAECLVHEILRHFKIDGAIFPQRLLQEISSGDLSDKLFNGGIAEHLLMPDLADWEFASLEPSLKMSRIPEDGLGGTALEWESPRPLSQGKLLVFGNSIFERGGAPLGLSWWVSRIFARTRFVWSDSLIDDEVREFQPDFIICQTVERFLPTLPDT